MANSLNTDAPENRRRQSLPLWRQVVSVALIVFFGGCIPLNLWWIISGLLGHRPEFFWRALPSQLAGDAIAVALVVLGFWIRRDSRRC